MNNMKQYRIYEDYYWEKDEFGIEQLYIRYKVQIKVLFFWITIKEFDCEDKEFGKVLAEELLEKLNERY